MRRFVKFLTALTFLLMLAVAPADSQTTATALIGARIIDGTGRPPIENGVVLMDHGRIEAVGKAGAVRIPEDAHRENLAGKTIMPALVDNHTHLGQTVNGLDPSPDAYTRQNIQAQLAHLVAYGVGAIAVMGTDRDLIYTLRDEEHAGELSGARIYTAGRGFGVKGGFPPGKGDAWDVFRPETPARARADVQGLALHHPDYVKLWVDDGYGKYPKMRPEIYQAIIEEAHRNHLRALAHVYYLADAKALLAAGIDGLMHSVRDQPVDQELISALKAHHVLYVPTLVRDESLFAYADALPWLSDPFFRAGLLPAVIEKLESQAFRQHAASDPDLEKNRASLAMGERNLKTLYAAGVRVGFGTDAGVPGRFLGYFEHRELQLMVQAGLTPMQAIVCATHNAGDFLDHDIGTLEPHKSANLLVLDGNPLDDIRNTEKLVEVWHNGESVKPIGVR